MKRIFVLAVMVFFAASVTVAFAETEKKEENLFKIIQNSIKCGPVKEKNKIKNPMPKVTAFQNMADGIKEGSEKAKGESLRSGNTK